MPIYLIIKGISYQHFTVSMFVAHLHIDLYLAKHLQNDFKPVNTAFGSTGALNTVAESRYDRTT